MAVLKLILVVCVLVIQLWQGAKSQWVNDANCGTRNANGKRSLLDTNLYKEHNMAKQIYGGVVSADGMWPWMVAILRQGINEVVCGGSLISSQWVLTAAHCVPNRNDLPQFSIQVGENTLFQQSDTYQTQTIDRGFTHAEYVNNLWDTSIDQRNHIMANDIGLLRLTDRVDLGMDNTNVLCLPPANARLLDYSSCTIAGWGLTEFGWKSSELRHAETRIFTRHSCHEGHPENKARVQEGSFCIDHENHSVDTCTGDSGGPLMCQDRQDRWVQLGINSWGWNCSTTLPGVEVDVKHYMDWIEQTITDNGGA